MTEKHSSDSTDNPLLEPQGDLNANVPSQMSETDLTQSETSQLAGDILALDRDTPHATDTFSTSYNQDETPNTVPPRQQLPVTICFSAILAIIYGLTSLPAGFAHISNLAAAVGSFYPPLVAQGQWWRFLSATMLHANPGHLFNNVFGLIIFGGLLEPILGGRRLLTLYFIAAMGGLTASYFFLPNTPSLGASTIDFGLIGAYFTLVLSLHYQQDRKIFSQELRSAFFFVLVFISWNMLEMQTINVWGHIGGLVGGIAYALWLWTRRKYA